MKRKTEDREWKQKKRLLKTLYLIQNEAESPVTYYTVDKICDQLNLPIPALQKVINYIRKAGFQAVPTHFNSRGIKTDASADIVKKVIAELAPKKR